MLFIDANAYLEFFASSQGGIQKLLPALVELKDEIFVTRQVVSEVERNKLKVAANSLRSHLDNLKIQSVRLPEHLDPTPERRIANWNKKAAALAASGKTIRLELEELLSEILESVRSSSDSTSMALAKVFSRALEPSDVILSRARLRKELGNPPGKSDDPLGDQLSWEMLIDALKPGEAVWLITKDGDYATEVKGNRYLNSYLMRDLVAKHSQPVDCYCFETIADGLDHFSKNRRTPVNAIPSAEELRAIAHEEAAIRFADAGSMGWPEPTVCYKCGSSAGFYGPATRPSIYGSWTIQWGCKSCGHWCDFGEPADC